MSAKTYVALLRGINVGGNNRLPMQTLRSLLQELGFQNVQTYIQSGNIVFQSPQTDPLHLASIITQAIQETHGFAPHTLVLSADEFQTSAQQNPYPQAEKSPKSLHLFFLESVPTNPDPQKLNTLKSPTEAFQLQNKTLYLHAPDGIGRSKLAASIEKTLQVPTTARNWNTVQNLLEMIPEE